MFPKAIIFDKDGVLVDFDRTWIAVLLEIADDLSNSQEQRRRLLDKAGYDFETQKFLSGSVWAAGSNADLIEVWGPELPGLTPIEINDFVVGKCLTGTPVPTVGLEKLRALFSEFADSNVLLAIATNDAEVSAVQTMDAFGLHPYLSLVMGYDSVRVPKPSPEPVELFCKRFGIASADVAVVGDNAHDMEMARSAGAGLKIGVLSGNSSRGELAPHADHLIEDVLELPELFRRLNMIKVKEDQVNVL